MNNGIIKSIIAGAIFGAIVYFTGPLIFIFFFAVMVLKFIFTPFGMGRMMMMNGMHHHGMGRPPMAFAEKIRNMSEEDYASLKERMQNRFQGGCCGGHYGNRNHETSKSDIENK